MRNRFLRHPLTRGTCWYLAFVLAGLLAAPSVVQAAFLAPSALPAEGGVAALDAAAIAALEDGLLAERLAHLGLTADEVQARIRSLTAEERQAVMADLGQVQAGGDGLGTLVTLAVLVLLVILILKLMNKKITVH